MKNEQQNEKEIICQKCGKGNINSNFCMDCGTKLKDVCECWIKKEPYNCGKEKCPSYRLFREIIEER